MDGKEAYIYELAAKIRTIFTEKEKTYSGYNVSHMDEEQRLAFAHNVWRFEVNKLKSLVRECIKDEKNWEDEEEPPKTLRLF